MSKVEQLKQILEEMDYAGMMDVIDNCWMFEDRYAVRWNTDNNITDLLDGEGETYMGYITEGTTMFENYEVMNVDTEQGYWQTLLFNKDSEVKDNG